MSCEQWRRRVTSFSLPCFAFCPRRTRNESGILRLGSVHLESGLALLNRSQRPGGRWKTSIAVRSQKGTQIALFLYLYSDEVPVGTRPVDVSSQVGGTPKRTERGLLCRN